MRKLVTFVCLNVCLSAFLLKAQSYSFIHYGVEEGLSQSVANTILQDDLGNLWVGTLAGLNRYDGYEFTVFQTQDSLAENWITSSYKDVKGNLWFGHWAGGATVYNWERKEFHNLLLEDYTDFKTISCITGDQEGNIWFGTSGGGIILFRAQDNSIIVFTDQDGLLSNNIFDLEVSDNGYLWIATDQGISRVQFDADKQILSGIRHLTVEKGLLGNFVTQIHFINDGVLAVGYADKGLSIVENPAVRPSYTHYNTEREFPSDQIQSMLYDQDGNLWIGTADAGIIKLHIDRHSFKNFSVEEGLDYFNIKSIFLDRENNIWVGSELGLNLFSGDQFTIYDESDGLINNVVWAVTGDREGRLWLGTNGGLSVIENGAFKSYSRADGLGDDVVISLLEDRSGNVWCGTSSGGVSRYNTETEDFTNFTTDDILPDNTVYTLAEDQKGNIWMGTRAGVLRYNPETGVADHFSEEDGLGGDNVFRIFSDSKGKVWIAALGGALTVYENGNFKQFDKSDGLDQRFIITISEDQKGTIWLGAYGGAIYSFDGEQFSKFQVKEEVQSNTPYSIMADSRNQLWIGTSQGMSLFDPVSGEIKEYGRREGFLGVEANSNAAFSDGVNIWIGSIMGVVKFNPASIRLNEIEPIVNIEDVKIQYESLDEDRAGSSLSHNENHITFKYVGVSLSNPEKVRYKYQLEGFDADYNPETPKTEATYSNLPPGEYTFNVIAANNDGLWTKEPHSYSIKIAPPFWETLWFYAICAVLIVGILVMIDRVRTQNLKRAKVVLENTVQERTIELRYKNDELAQKNKDITDSIRYAKRIQQAILPEDEVFRSHLPEAFVYFHPKDIVSGDFYWIDKVGEQVVVTAVDCTGHGVPGAFMSLVGYNGLNKIISEGQETDPSAILYKLNKNVSNALKQTDRDEGVNDGMDMAICTIDPKRKKLFYAGANNPLYAIQDGELSEIKATKRPIGYYSTKEKFEFEQHEVNYKKGDRFYIFSDGFADQFGGEQGKKFKTRAFKELLVSIWEKPMHEQNEILRTTITRWRGDLEQVDDICVIGFAL